MRTGGVAWPVGNNEPLGFESVIAGPAELRHPAKFARATLDEDSTSVMAEQTPLSVADILGLIASYPKLPLAYLDFLRNPGWGTAASGGWRGRSAERKPPLMDTKLPHSNHVAFEI